MQQTRKFKFVAELCFLFINLSKLEPAKKLL